MTTNDRFVRIHAGDIRPGMRVGRTRKEHDLFTVSTTRRGPKAIALYRRTPESLRAYNQQHGWGTPPEQLFARPQHHQAWWRDLETPLERELRLDEERIADQMEAEAVRGISAPDY